MRSEKARWFYVSVCDKAFSPRGTDYRLLAGPFYYHDDAKQMVDRAQALAEKLDPKGVWYSYGTLSVEGEGRPRLGILNDQLGMVMAKSHFEEDTLVEATADGVTVRKGDKGRVIETGDWEYHRVYWPAYKLFAYHLGSQLRTIEVMKSEPCDCMDCEIAGEPTH